MFVRILIFAAALISISCKENSSENTQTNGITPQILNEIDFTVIDTDLNRSGYSYLNIIDNDYNTFFTTYELNLNESRFITVDFGAITEIAKIELFDNYTNSWALGDMDIYASDDDSNYVLLDSILATEMASSQGLAEHSVSVTTRYIKIVMTYNGSGAYGSTPSFYLSELLVYSPAN